MLVALGFRALAPWYFLTNVLELPQEIRLVAFAALIANTSFTAFAALIANTSFTALAAKLPFLTGMMATFLFRSALKHKTQEFHGGLAANAAWIA